MERYEYHPEEARERGRRPTAFDFRRRYEWLNRFSDEELREISLCYDDELLCPGEQYFDISHPEKGIIIGRSGEQVPSGCCYVAKSEVSPQIWEKLISGFVS